MSLSKLDNLTSNTDIAAAIGDVAGITNGANRNNSLVGWTMDPMTASVSSLVPAVATMFVTKIPVPQKISVTNIMVSLTALGAGTLTHSYLSLYNSTGVVIGQSADQTTTWGSAGATGFQTVALASGPFTFTPASVFDYVWVGLYIGTNTAGALPKFQTGAVNGGSGLINAGLGVTTCRSGSIAIADTATPGNITPTSLGLAAFPLWAGLS